MQTHRDSDYMDMLRARAELMKDAQASQITTGKPGEEVVQQYEHNGVQVVQLPDDPQLILRISIGGGDHIPTARPINYCNFRGDPGMCIALLEKCLEAMKQAQ